MCQPGRWTHIPASINKKFDTQRDLPGYLGSEISLPTTTLNQPRWAEIHEPAGSMATAADAFPRMQTGRRGSSTHGISEDGGGRLMNSLSSFTWQAGLRAVMSRKKSSANRREFAEWRRVLVTVSRPIHQLSSNFPKFFRMPRNH